MDRRSWLWRRKSSEKSPGETESSGSISSRSERFSDEQAYPNHNTQSPEVTSKAAPSDEEVNDNVKSLTEKLSAALLNISAKEDLVKQHAKVAEEAVSGWEKAENEVLSLKQQLEAATQKNSALEDRIVHLDGALKECVRQIRQAREEQEQKIHEAVVKRNREWESTKSEFESQLVELQAQLQTAKAEVVASIERDTDIRPKLEAVEKENLALKLELFSRAEELKVRIIERDLSTKAAETASKQHLESIKKVVKLEAECRRLKAVSRKAASANDNRSFTASSVYVESFTDSQSDSGERLMAIETDMRKMSGLEVNDCEPGHSNSWASALITELDQFKNEKAPARNLMVPSGEINLMDDFLEMERLAALPGTESGSPCLEAGAVSDQPIGEEISLKSELEAMAHRTFELEEKLKRMEAEKVEANLALTECQKQLKMSYSLLKQAEVKLVELQTQLALANESKQASEEEMQATNAKREVAESQLRGVEAEIKALLSKVCSLEEEVEKEQALSAETVAKCRKLEDELSRMKHDDSLRHAISSNGELKLKQEKELQVAASKFAECQQTIASLGQQLKSLATLEDFLIDSEKPLDLNVEGSQCLEECGEPWKLHSSDLYLLNRDFESSKVVGDCLSPPKNGGERGTSLSPNQAVTSEKSQNGFGKLFTQGKKRDSK
ncbi:hypothetical protein L1049_020027 [Liquidambar formosana]|uniref:Filament-like plant protein n=1 Tax=Liquidambar formosana TaxID=63359 RepID=A0AAP0X725_LIQFO